MDAKMKRYNHGVADFEAHAINISGGIKPNTVSDSRKTEKIFCAEYVATRLFRMELKSNKKYSNARSIATKATITIPPLMDVLFRKE